MANHNVRAFWHLPSKAENQILIMDTSFVYEVYGKTKDPELQRQCQNFITDTAASGAILATTIKTQEELRIVATRDLVHSDSFQRKKILNSNTSAMEPVENLVQNITDQLVALGNYYPEPLGQIDVKALSGADDIMRKYGVEYPDAMILQLGVSNGADGLITLDGDLGRQAAVGLPIYTSRRRYLEWAQDNGIKPDFGMPGRRPRQGVKPDSATGTESH